MDYGYIRVSTIEQNVDRQLIAMREVGVPETQIYMDKQSGKDFNRPGFQELLWKLQPGDTLFVKSIDRLGRNYDEILFQWRFIHEQKGAHIVVLDMPLLDTRDKKDLMGKVISDIVLQLLSYVAQTEREFIRQRQAEGIAAAKERGVHFGRKALDKPSGFWHWSKMYENRLVTAREAASALGVSHTTFLRWVNQKGEINGNM